MKRIASLVVLVFFTANCFAQLPVNTTAQKKKIAFEEFTGIYCSGCPGGHLISDGLKTTYPNDFFPIYIHDSPFADPRLPSDPDFRTAHGPALLNALGTNFVPVASVNRKVYTGGVMGLDKPDWTTYVDVALQEDAYVNVAFEATINVLTRELIVNSEIYVTASGGPSSMKLNLSIAQNDVEGPQKSSYNNPAYVLPNGNYLHQHQFKEFITGQWGALISTPLNTLVTRTDTYYIPLDYNGVVFELYDMEIVGSIAEGTTRIINANKCEITYIVPSNVNLIDLSIKSNKIITDDLCDSTFTPTVTVYNNGAIQVDSFDVVTSLNGVLQTGEAFYPSLQPGDSIVLVLSEVTVSSRKNSVKYLINTHNYGTYYDTVSLNNYSAADDIFHIPASSVITTFEEDFEYTSLSVSIPNSYMINTNTMGKFVALQASHFGATEPIGGFGNSTKSMWIGAKFYTQPEYVEITIGKFDLSANLAYDLEFAYSSQLMDTASVAKIEFLVSNDCGVSWTTMWSKQGASLATVSGLYSGIIFAPKANEWLKGAVDLSNYTGDSAVIIRMEFTPDVSTNMCAGIFIDDFELTSGPVGIKQLNNSLEGAFSLYPNPASGLLNIGYGQLITQSGEVEIINFLGKVVQRETLPAYTDKSQINISNLAGGVYFVRFVSGGFNSTQKLIIE